MEMIRAGPMGKKGVDNSEVEWDDKGRTKISQINVTYDDLIRSIQFGYLENGSLVLSKNYGPSEEGDNIFRVVKLEDNEYVTGLSVVLGLHGGIRLLTVHTNRGKYGPIGRLEDKHLNDCKIEFVPEKDDCREFGGFFGSYNKFMLSSIGIYLSPFAMSGAVIKR